LAGLGGRDIPKREEDDEYSAGGDSSAAFSGTEREEKDEVAGDEQQPRQHASMSRNTNNTPAKVTSTRNVRKSNPPILDDVDEPGVYGVYGPLSTSWTYHGLERPL